MEVLNGILLREGLADEIHLLIHPELVGGMEHNSIFNAQDITSLEDVIKVKLIHINKLKDNIIWLRYEVTK